MKNEPEFIKYPEIPHLAENLGILDSRNIQVFEKIDGGNCQIRTYNGRVFCGSRANFLKRKEDFRFPWFEDFNKWAMSNQSLRNLPENIIVFGEFTGPHTLIYDPEFTNRFFLIDLYHMPSRRFVPYDKARKQLEDIAHIDDVLFLRSLAGELNLDSAKYLATGKSEYSSDRREGIVIKDYKRQKFAKFWRTSANPTKEGMYEEISKTIASLKTKYPSVQGLLDDKNTPYDAVGLPDVVYEELLRSGRRDVSLAEISDTIKKVINKI